MSLDNLNALTTVVILEAELGLTTSVATTTVLERLILAATEAIEKFCDRRFRKAAATESYAGTGTQRLVLDRQPLVSIESVSDADVVVPAATYRIENAEAGFVWGDNAWTRRGAPLGIAQEVVPGTGEKTIDVAYTAGYVLPGDTVGTRDLPRALEEACILTVTSMYRARGVDRRISSESVGDASVGYGGVNTAIGRGMGGVIPDEAAVMLQPYRRIF